MSFNGIQSSITCWTTWVQTPLKGQTVYCSVCISMFQQWGRELSVNYKSCDSEDAFKDWVWMTRMCRMCMLATTAGIYYTLSDYCGLVSIHLCRCVQVHYAFSTCVCTYSRSGTLPSSLIHTHMLRWHWRLLWLPSKSPLSHIFIAKKRTQQELCHRHTVCICTKRGEKSTCGQPPEVYDPRGSKVTTNSSWGQEMRCSKM